MSVFLAQGARRLLERFVTKTAKIKDRANTIRSAFRIVYHRPVIARASR